MNPHLGVDEHFSQDNVVMPSHLFFKIALHTHVYLYAHAHVKVVYIGQFMSIVGT